MPNNRVRIKGMGWCLSLGRHKGECEFFGTYVGYVRLGGGKVPVFRSAGSQRLYIMYKIDVIENESIPIL